MTNYRKKMIEVAMPLEAINKESAREKSIRHGHPSTLHLWWARRPLASCRAVLFGQLVDDPSSWPERFPTEEAQDAERQRLFRILEELVLWENSNNTRVLNAARKEIAQSLARNRVADGEGSERDDEVLAESVSPEVVNAYLAEVAPPVHDPFAGGGSIPLEAQRLGLRAIATDLNPVAVLINKALIEIPPKFAGRAPVHPKAEKRTNWKGAEGLAEDVRCYGEWLRDEAKKHIGNLYPEVDLPDEHGGGTATVIAWIWARTVESPDPAFKGVHVPLVSNFFLSTKKGKEAWIEPVIEGQDYRFEIRTGKPADPAEIKKGTKLGRGANFRCVMSGSPIEPNYIKAEGKAGNLKSRLMAIATQAQRKRIYLPAQESQVAAAESAEPTWIPSGNVPERLTGGTCFGYGLKEWGDLFTPRQLVALTQFSDLVSEARNKVFADARATDLNGDQAQKASADKYADAIATYLAFSVSKALTRNCSLALWESGMGRLAGAMGRQAIPMSWSYAETNPLGGAGGDIKGTAWSIAEVLDCAPASTQGLALQASADAAQDVSGPVTLCTDPPYYDNIAYADLSDFFYVWLRRSLRNIHDDLFATLAVPKADELVAAAYRHGGPEAAMTFFETGMARTMRHLRTITQSSLPVTIYYAFKQSQSDAEGTTSTGWSTFLQGLCDAGFQVISTIPVRTEATNALKRDISALASSVVLTCRARELHDNIITRGEFRRILLRELPDAIHRLEKGNIAPVDMSQASVGPGMAVFSRHSKIIEADGSNMPVRTALQIINEVIDEVRGGEGMEDLDPETRFATTWFQEHGYAEGPFGEAEVLATARGVSVDGVAESGVLYAAGGKARLLQRHDMPNDWDPATDTTLTVWECMQHLIKRLEDHGEEAAAALLKAIGPRAESARTLAYSLYTHCERKGDATEAGAYNALVVAWPELEELSTKASNSTTYTQGTLPGSNE